MFWLVIESSGLTETAKVKKARLGLGDGGRRHQEGDSRGSNRRSARRPPIDTNSGQSPRNNSSTGPPETQRPPVAPQEDTPRAPPSIQTEYLDWKLNQLIALRSEINDSSDSDSDMESANSQYEYFGNEESYRTTGELKEGCPCRDDWAATGSEGLSCF